MLMTDEDRSPEPNTVPPPHGAKDMYSAQTRIGTLPEEVLAAMRTEASDASLASRTSSAALARLRPPMPPSLESVLVDLEPETPPVIVSPEIWSRASVLRSLVVILLFAALGGLLAAAITLW